MVGGGGGGGGGVCVRARVVVRVREGVRARVGVRVSVRVYLACVCVRVSLCMSLCMSLCVSLCVCLRVGGSCVCVCVTWTTYSPVPPSSLPRYGISAWNPQGAPSPPGALSDTAGTGEGSSVPSNSHLNQQLLEELEGMHPRPSSVRLRQSRAVDGSWEEAGFAVRFDEPSLEAERGLLFLARMYGQVGAWGAWGV